MPKITHTLSKIVKRKLRVRGKLFGTNARPRLSINRSNKHTYLQAISDEQGVTVAYASDVKIETGTKTERAVQAAETLAKALMKQGIKAVIIDRGSFRYHGRIKAVADAVRAAGVEV
ncbi:MAG TPA: 50S ribosomal protein L18 [Vitreimonas sp.]|nr:50S ribosomal protein L18 [Vitreimonas sp.]